MEDISDQLATMRKRYDEALVATLRYEAGEMAAQRDAATSRAEAAEAEVVQLRGELVASVDERNRLGIALGRAEEAVAARDDALVTALRRIEAEVAGKGRGK